MLEDCWWTQQDQGELCMWKIDSDNFQVSESIFYSIYIYIKRSRQNSLSLLVVCEVITMFDFGQKHSHFENPILSTAILLKAERTSFVEELSFNASHLGD